MDIDSSAINSLQTSFVKSLVPLPNTSVEDFKLSQRKQFRNYDLEMVDMKVSLKEKPSADSLMSLYQAQVKGKGYSERAGEIYRVYLQYFSTVKMLKLKAEMQYKEEYNKALNFVLANNTAEFKTLKGAEERSNYVSTFIPTQLREELFQWQCIEQEASTNFQVIKSYYESFKSIKDEILVQLSIVKQLIALGGLKIDPEAVRAMQVIDSSYKPTRQDFNDKRAEEQTSVSIEEGVIDL